MGVYSFFAVFYKRYFFHKYFKNFPILPVYSIIIIKRYWYRKDILKNFKIHSHPPKYSIFQLYFFSDYFFPPDYILIS